MGGRLGTDLPPSRTGHSVRRREVTARLPGSINCVLKCRMKGCSGWQRQVSMLVEEIMNLTWHAATSAGAANISSTHISKAYSSGRSWMGGTLRMTPGLSMCLMPRLTIGA